MNGRGTAGSTGVTSAPSAVVTTPSAVMTTPSAAVPAAAMAPLGLGETGGEQHRRQNNRRSSYCS